MLEALSSRLFRLLLRHAPLVCFIGLCLAFGASSPRFLTLENLNNILIQSSSLAIVAVGMTFVLLTAGIDLSVGASMLVSAVVAGKLALAGAPAPLWIGAVAAVGLLYGAVNALFIVGFRLMAFVVTLATLYFGRGLGLWITKTQAMNLPETVLWIGTANVAAVPIPFTGWTLRITFPLLISALVVVAAHLVLTRTAFGRQVYAVGQDPEAARKAGIAVRRILLGVYLICGFCAAVGGLVSVAQLGAVSPTFGLEREFLAIAMAVLGGTSLFGGRGSVLPGTVLGALYIQTVESGLVIMNAEPYVHRLATASLIFLAVLVDSARHQQLLRLGRRRIRVEKTGTGMPAPADRSSG